MDNTIKVVGFIGKKQSGKTTAAKHLVDNYGYVRIRVADALKQMLYALGLTEREVDGDLKECACDVLCGMTPRHAMITLGTEWGRNMIHPRLWVKKLDGQMCYLMAKGHRKFVIDDIRFMNEAEWIKDIREDSVGTIETCLIRIIRGDKVVLNHQSETEQDAIFEDWSVYNNGTLESMYKSINDILIMNFKEN